MGHNIPISEIRSPPFLLEDVRFGSKADICAAKDNVRFTPESEPSISPVASSDGQNPRRVDYADASSCSDSRIVKGLRRRPHRPAWGSNTPWQRAPQVPHRPSADRVHAVMSYQSRPINTAPQA